MWEQVEQQNKNDMNETNRLQYASLPSDAAKPHTLGLLNNHSLRSHAGRTWLGVELRGPTFARQSFRGSGRERLLPRTVRKSGGQWPCRKAANKVITQWFKLVPLVPSHACSNPQPRCLPILRWPMGDAQAGGLGREGRDGGGWGGGAWGRVAVKVSDVAVTTSRNNLIPRLQPSSADLLLQGH